MNLDASFCKKVEKGVPYRHPKVIGPKPTWWQFGTFRGPFNTPKVPNWLFEAERAFVFECHLVSPSRVFGPVIVSRHVFILRLWFFISFLDNSDFFKNNYLVDKSLKINLDKFRLSTILLLSDYSFYSHACIPILNTYCQPITNYLINFNSSANQN